VLASSSLDAAIHLWDTDTGEKIRSVENGPMDAWTVAFSPCSKKVVSGSHVGKINLFSTENGQNEQVLDTTGKFTFSIAYVSNQSHRSQPRQRCCGVLF
jgi:WD repeat-containing protein 61